MKFVSMVIHSHVDHFLLGLRHLIIGCLISHLPLDGRFQTSGLNGGPQPIGCGHLPFHILLEYHYLDSVKNTHIGKSAVKKCKASQLRKHLELVVAGWNSYNSNLNFDYVSGSELHRVHLKKSAQECYE
jgi:hypothetical protein